MFLLGNDIADGNKRVDDCFDSKEILIHGSGEFLGALEFRSELPSSGFQYRVEVFVNFIANFIGMATTKHSR
jgi:hypothetical protein